MENKSLPTASSTADKLRLPMLTVSSPVILSRSPLALSNLNSLYTTSHFTKSIDSLTCADHNSVNTGAMKGGDVAMAALSTTINKSTVSPMINIPAGIFKELMSAEKLNGQDNQLNVVLNGNNGVAIKTQVSAGVVKLGINSDAANKKSSLNNVNVNGELNHFNSLTDAICNGVNKVIIPNHSTSVLPTIVGSSTSTSQLNTISSRTSLSSSVAVDSNKSSTTTTMSSLNITTASLSSDLTHMEVSQSVDTTPPTALSTTNTSTHSSNIYTTTSNSTSNNNTIVQSTAITASLLKSTLNALDPLLEGLPDITNGSCSTLTPLSPVMNATELPMESEELMELTPVQIPCPATVEATNSSAEKCVSEQLEEIKEKKENSNGEFKVLKRFLAADNSIAKKQRLSLPSEESSNKQNCDNKYFKKENKDLINIEVEKMKESASKLHKLKRKDLENLILQLFMDKLLYDHEIGKYKTLCEKLESTLEANRKKTTQFHKEMEDLRKVTKRLTEEHQNRKDQLVTPIKIKRSVGIQAAPHIIMRGMANSTNSNNNSTASPKASIRFNPALQINGNSPTSGFGGNSSQMVLVNPPSSASNVADSAATPTSSLRTAASGVRLNNNINDNRRFFVSQPLNTPNMNVNTNNMSPSPGTGSNNSNTAGNSSAVIDLTDEEEGRGAKGTSSSGGSLTKVSTQQSFVTLQPGSLPANAQYVLVPNSSGSTTAVMVANVASSSPMTSSVSSPVSATGNRLLMATIPSQPTKLPPLPHHNSTGPVHPAPLPRTAPQQVVGGAKKLPPQPTLKLSHKDNSIVLSWTMAKTSEHEGIASYQLYAYQESSQTPSPSLWKKVGSVKALELPMACTLTQFMPGHRYHFAVRAVDTKSRLGQFSDPRSIRLEK